MGPVSNVNGGARNRRATDITATWALLAGEQTLLRVIYPKETNSAGVQSLACGPRNMSPRLAAAAAASALPLPLPSPAVAAPSRTLRALVLSPGAAAAVSSTLLRRGAPACLVRRLCSSHHSSAAAAATAVEEARRGRKQLGMTPPLYDYLLANVREHPVRHSLSTRSCSEPICH